LNDGNTDRTSDDLDPQDSEDSILDEFNHVKEDFDRAEETARQYRAGRFDRMRLVVKAQELVVEAARALFERQTVELAEKGRISIEGARHSLDLLGSALQAHQAAVGTAERVKVDEVAKQRETHEHHGTG
jgi:hypothetical protein